VKEATFHLLIGLLHFATFSEQVTLDDNVECKKSRKLTLIIPAKARDYGITGLSVCPSVCLFVCYHDN